MAKKKSKLREKGARIPETRERKWDGIVKKYVGQCSKLNTESARSHRFGMVAQQLVGQEPGFIEKYVEGIEKYVRGNERDRFLRGKVDNLFGNVVIEFESDLKKKREEAEEQLRRYVSILWSREERRSRRPYICMATDGVRFVTYTPRLGERGKENVEPEDVSLDVVEEVDWGEMTGAEVYFWLDRYLLREELLPPTTEAIVRDFGPGSHAFRTVVGRLSSAWEELKEESSFAVVFETWEKYLRIVYGGEVGSSELFMRHTYLATLAKLMAWARMSGSEKLPKEEEILEMLSGKLFKRYAIGNFIEEDFFAWVVREGATEVGLSCARWLFSLLKNYNLRELSEDVLKALYQELVDPETRHDLGEYYTPDWLAHKMVNRLLEENEKGAFLDPACGSGTFLYLLIKEKKERLGSSVRTLKHILRSACGADVHPLAVIVAKTNYVLALGDLLGLPKRGAVSIPVYLSDTVKLPERGMFSAEREIYEAQLGEEALYLDSALLEKEELFDRGVELARDFAEGSGKGEIGRDGFAGFLRAQGFEGATDERVVDRLLEVASVLKGFIERGRDTIWAFVLKNFYKPLLFKGRFDFVVGNPPWISYRYMAPGYQAFLKREVTQRYKLLTGKGHLITHLEIAALFLVRGADLYLKEGGAIAFVMPRSVFTGDQHDGLRRGEFRLAESVKQGMKLEEVWDCESVEPLFNVPACVIFGRKRQGIGMRYPIPYTELAGKLSAGNASLADAEKALRGARKGLTVHIRGSRSFWEEGEGTTVMGESYYMDKFRQGGSIVPRCFWFVAIKQTQLGYDERHPWVETDRRAEQTAKEPYRVKFDGNVESQFIYRTLVSTDLVPFGHVGLRQAVLPMMAQRDRYAMLKAEEARDRGYVNLASWLQRAEAQWKKRRGGKAGGMTIYERLDRYRGLTAQNPKAGYRVVYPDVQRIATCCVVKVEPDMVIDYTNYFAETSVKEEAWYTCAVLNSSEVDVALASMRRRDQRTHPHVTKKVLELPIPEFNAEDKEHEALARLGAECGKKVEDWIREGKAGKVKSIGKIRSMIREMLKEELGEIDKLVRRVLGLPVK